MLKKLSLLVLLIGNCGEILSQKQTDSGKICLNYREFDFYAQSIVERQGLRIDTGIYIEQIRVQDRVIRNIDRQLGNLNDIVINKDKVIVIRNKDFADLSVNFSKQQKKIKRYKQSTLTFATIIAVLCLLVAIK